MRSRLNNAIWGILGMTLLLFAGACHHRGERAREMEEGNNRGDRGEKIAPSDATKDGKEVTVSLIDKGGEDLPEKEELRRVYQLEPGALVEIDGINGSIDVETADGEIAEVLIVRSAKKRDDLQFRQMNIFHQPNRLRIKTEEDRRSVFSEMAAIPDVKQRVMLKVPQNIRFATYSLNGNLTTGVFDGKVEVNRVNGLVKIGRATGEAFFREINGDIEATIANLSDEGIRLSGVNGNTRLRFVGDVNANIEANGFLGEVQPDLPNVEVQGSESMVGSYKARIGSGGVRIGIEGVNGNVYLEKAGKSNNPEAAKASPRAK